MTQVEATIQAKRVFVAAVQEAPWNVNVLQGEKYEQLGADMKAAGPEGTGPIDTCVLDGEKYTCDGSHRLRWARRLGWTHLYEIFHPEIATEEQARLFNFKRDFERGDVDPFKLAASFKWFVDKGLKQEEIAAKFGIDKSTVSRRLSLLGLDVEVKKQVVTDTAFTVSSMEPLATLPVSLQGEALKEIKRNSERGVQLSSRHIEEVVQDVKEEYEARKKLTNSLEQSKFKKCPTCGKPPEKASYDGLPWVKCSQGWSSEHEWNLQTGATKRHLENADRKIRMQQGAAKARKGPDQFVRTTHTPSEFKDAYANFAREIIPTLASIDEVELKGKNKAGEKVSVHVDEWYGSGQVTVEIFVGPKRLEFILSPESYKVAALKDFKATIRPVGKTLRTESERKELEEVALGFLEKYGPKLPRGNSKKK